MNNPSVSLDEAVAAYKGGRLDEAEALGHAIIRANPQDVWALHMLGLIARRRGDAQTEIEFLKRALAADPDHVESLVGLANVLRILSQPGEGILLCERAVRIKPTYVNAYSVMGLCHAGLGAHKRAAECLELAISIDPKQPVVLVALAESLRQLGRPVEAANCYNRTLALDPNNANAHEGLGHLLLYEERQDEAIRHFTRALAVEPESPRRLLHLAEAKGRRGFIEESISLIDRALQIEPDSASALCLRGTRMQDLGNFDAAISSFERSLAVQPQQGHAYFGFFTSKKASAQDNPRIEGMEQIAEEGSIAPVERMRLQTALSKAYDDLELYKEAVEHMENANRIALSEFVGAKPLDRARVSRYVADAVGHPNKEFLRGRESCGSDSEQPVFIVGMPRSGTTLLEQILSAHPQVAAGGELRFWGEVHASRAQGVLGLSVDKTGAGRVVKQYLSLLNQIGPGARFVTDKMPNNFFYLGVIHQLFPNARFIHCRRNPIDNCVSLFMTSFRHRPAFTYSREDILFYYEQYQTLMDHWKAKVVGERLVDVDYESLVANPEEETRRVLGFCNLDWNDACGQPEKGTRNVTTPSMWQVRQPVYNTSVDKWKNYEPWLGEFVKLLGRSEGLSR